MPLNGAHFLLTYRCDRKCDHCFLYAAPDARGTFSIEQVELALSQLTEIESVETVFFEGGEPFLYYPTMLEGVRLARRSGFEAGIVTNGYWAASPRDGRLCLEPLRELSLSSLCVSDDPLHGDDRSAQDAVAAAEEMGMSVSCFRTPKPSVETGEDGEPVVTGGVMFRGRAVERLVDGLPTRPGEEFGECPHESLDDPGRVHLDAYGNVHLCQGLLMGNAWQTPLPELVARYEPAAHPICGPLLQGGPARLAEEYGLGQREGYVDACHLCYEVRRALLERFPRQLGPPQVYGL